ncbi:lipoprotein insertase outer membrane protein LolB [Limnohabitans sp.]|jgi:outer membrane lipoprotein LolB|uniref:lipoprotein insertase outer membrane protein LolB n=1 Tax=Limnohabitans sp. TaxID=1907725 RepID=UPI0039BD735B|nr:outer membrane lipoprotein LolB [Comamonadaceae bacterium]
MSAPGADFSGRLAIQVLKDPPESLSASFELQGSAQSGQMLLLSPIGTTLARLQWQPEFARLEQGQQQIDSSSLQQLATQLTGTELPILALFEWLAGRAATAAGWQVDLSQHAQGRITAERRLPTPATVLRIALDR